MTSKVKAKDRKSRQLSIGAAPVVDDDSFYALLVNISGAPVVPFPFSKDLFLKVGHMQSPPCSEHLQVADELICAPFVGSREALQPPNYESSLLTPHAH
jgi:hypothetical protein